MWRMRFAFRLCLGWAPWALLICLLLPSFAQATMVRLYTSLGPMDIVLLDSAAPITVKNFLAYVEAGRAKGKVVIKVK